MSIQEQPIDSVFTEERLTLENTNPCAQAFPTSKTEYYITKLCYDWETMKNK